jgi:hypothetical protein
MYLSLDIDQHEHTTDIDLWQHIEIMHQLVAGRGQIQAEQSTILSARQVNDRAVNSCWPFTR